MESGSRNICINTVLFISIKLNYRIIPLNVPGEKLRNRQVKWLPQRDIKSMEEKKQLPNILEISPQSTDFSLDCQNHSQGSWVSIAQRILSPSSFFLLNIMGEEETPDLKVYLPFLSLTFQEECH